MERYRSARAFGLAASVLIGLRVVDSFARAVSDWQGGDYPLAVPSFLLEIATAAVFVWWMYQVRINAEVLTLSHHDHARVWVVGGWLVPLVNLWYPKVIIDDIWRATAPRRQASELVTGWWAAFVTMNVFGFLSVLSPPDNVGLTAGLATAEALLSVVAAYTAALVVHRIDQAQAGFAASSAMEKNSSV